jgi:hypothetical protein
MKNIVSLGTLKKEDIKERLEHHLCRFVKSYYAKTEAVEARCEEVFLDDDFITKETKKLTLILVFERLKSKKDARANFVKEFLKGDEARLSKVPLCHHVWKYSAQEAESMLWVCTERARDPTKNNLHELCQEAADTLLTKRSQKGNRKNTKKSQLFVHLRGFDKLGVMPEVDLDDIKEHGFRERAALSTFFGTRFFAKCNEIIFEEEEED